MDAEIRSFYAAAGVEQYADQLIEDGFDSLSNLMKGREWAVRPEDCRHHELLQAGCGHLEVSYSGPLYISAIHQIFLYIKFLLYR